MTVIATLIDFLGARKKDLLVGLIIWLLLIGFKMFLPEAWADSRYRLLGEITLIFVLPLGALWEWREYKKNSDKFK